MRLLLINPNTTPAITQRMAELARGLAGPDDAVAAVTGRFGARYISDRIAYAIAGHAALDAYAACTAQGTPHDVVALACFGDPGLLALRALAPVPAIGMAEASMQEAATGGRRFGVVTGGRLWVPMLEEFAAGLGLVAQLAKVAAVERTGGAIAQDPDAALAELTAACGECVGHGAAVVILGGAGLAGLAPRIQDRVAVPLIDSLEALIRGARRLVGQAPPPAARVPADSTGLSPELAALLKAR